VYFTIAKLINGSVARGGPSPTPGLHGRAGSDGTWGLGHGHCGGQQRGHPGVGAEWDTRGHPRVLHAPQAVIKGDTASLSKDWQSPLNL